MASFAVKIQEKSKSLMANFIQLTPDYVYSTMKSIRVNKVEVDGTAHISQCMKASQHSNAYLILAPDLATAGEGPATKH